jgi:hypothetical protein
MRRFFDKRATVVDVTDKEVIDLFQDGLYHRAVDRTRLLSPTDTRRRRHQQLMERPTDSLPTTQGAQVYTTTPESFAISGLRVQALVSGLHYSEIQR